MLFDSNILQIWVTREKIQQQTQTTHFWHDYCNKFIIKNYIMSTGTVKFFNETKGFGFIKVDGSSEEIFVHVSGLQDEIRQDDQVTFDVERGKKGMNAVNVRLA